MNMELWEKILLGAGALLLIFVMRPGLKAAMEKSRQAEQKDWRGILIPLVMVVFFVLLLIALVRR